ncbi:hypothetical protein YTPLAS18_37760 [Nitrospira sp.]|nr:hypothetical protein YTPLAS18_37760 [Nitrospira sp.]
MTHPVATQLAAAAGRVTLGVWIIVGLVAGGDSLPAWAEKKHETGKAPSAAAHAAMDYVNAVGRHDAEQFAQLDFACLYEGLHASQQAARASTTTNTCLEQLGPIHAQAIQQKAAVMHAQWPGHGRTVFFSRPLTEYPVSTFVMDLIGQAPPGSGFDVQYVGERTLPKASFPAKDGSQTILVPTTLVRLTISYKDPLSAPLAYAPGTFQWTSTVERPRIAIRSLSLQLVVFTGLSRHGYPSDTAVLNRPVSTIERTDVGVQQAIPFATESSGAVEQSMVAWQPQDMPGLLIAAVARSQHFPELEDRMAMLNRVLLLDPKQPEALTTLSRDLYVRVLATGDAALPRVTPDGSMARRLAELSWNHYAQTTRMDLSLGMDMGGFAEPTAADYLYRMIPAMEMLAEVRPMNLDNRLYLGIAYRWNNDQLKAIDVHETLLRDLAHARKDQQARALYELAWSRINKAAWNREIDDPDIHKAYAEAEKAHALTADPLERFLAAYTMAYSQIFMPQRDTHLMLANLTEAKRWFELSAGATPEAWQFAMSRESLKAVLDTDPKFGPLLAATDEKQG